MLQLTSVLLVDDDSTTNLLNQLLLHNMHVSEQVLTAENGQEALDTLTQLQAEYGPGVCPQLIFLDLNMPVMNGVSFLEAYQQTNPCACPSAIIVLANSLPEREAMRARRLPIAGFLTKPLTREKITAVLLEHFPSLSL
jgi:CheY-like chemotaxis protein